ncbi:MAG TPA: hypothetical protein VNG70_06460 [Candidatus Limnocylindria bacterium]|jgi:hypothetical protein|nr:hypothetical protein [Candidatus Limnocylindria bacterium]
MKPLTVARLREQARALELPLDDEELASLRPMVEDLLAVARRLRHYQAGILAGPDQRPGSAAKPG